MEFAGWCTKVTTDPFGETIAPMFSHSFAEMLHINLRFVTSHKDAEILKRWLVDDFAPAHVLFLFNDNNIQALDARVRIEEEPQPAGQEK